MALSVINKAPGVYIEEVQLPGPIAGVGTSTVAFIGPARRGPINTPTFITNWSQFLAIFGAEDPLGTYITAPQVYVTHAVRGFFDNGGTTCYFVRVGTGKQAKLDLEDLAKLPALTVTAKQESTTPITVKVEDAHILPATPQEAPPTVERPENVTLLSAEDNHASVDTGDADKATKFRPGDVVSLTQGTTNDRVTIDRVVKDSSNKATITFRETLAHKYTASATMRIADLRPGQRRLRITNVSGIEAGTNLRIKQVTGTSPQDEVLVVQSVEPANKAITFTQGLTKFYSMNGATPVPVTLETLEFSLQITQSNTPEDFVNLSLDPRHSRYFADVVKSSYVDVTLADPPSPTPLPNNRLAVVTPDPAATSLTGKLADGQAEDITAIQTTHYRSAIDTLENVDDVNILCIPDSTNMFPTLENKLIQAAATQEIQQHMIDHCEKMQDRFAILDAGPGLSPNEVRAQRGLISSDGGYAALYYPWIVIANPVGPGRITVPPSGHVAGVYARVDDTRGVHKAPANETIRGVLALKRALSDDEQGPLNEQGINVIRSFPGSGVRVWGARTIAPRDRTQWRYVNVRRLLLFIEESLQEGTQFAVFEPNDLALWGKLKRQVTDFLTRVWRNGALFGADADQAFRVRIDEELNPPDLRALGQLIIEVIVVPTTPAEFIVFRIISDTTGKALVQE